MAIRDNEVLAVLTADGATARLIWIKLGMWAETSVRRHLVKLATEGRCVRVRQEIPSGYQWLYSANPS